MCILPWCDARWQPPDELPQPKIALSMKSVNQTTGEDKDPSNTALPKPRVAKRSEPHPFQQPSDGDFGGRSADGASEGHESWGTGEAAAPAEQPNFEVSGKLVEEANTYKGVVIKYSEPAEARKPKVDGLVLCLC